MSAHQQNRFASELLLPLLRGYGQILFQPSVATGAVFALTILIVAPEAFVVSLACAVAAACFGWWLVRPEPGFYDGSAIFNAVLTGLALGSLLEFSLMLPLVALCAGVVTVVVQAWLLRKLSLPVFTLPFIVTTWLALLVCTELLGLHGVSSLPVEGSAFEVPGVNAAQVLFATEQWVGAAVILGVLAYSRSAALWVFIAAVASCLLSLMLNLPEPLLAQGLLGYNALILASALHARSIGPISMLAGIMVSVLLSYGLLELGVTILSLPFVLSAWLVISIDKMRRNNAL